MSLEKLEIGSEWNQQSPTAAKIVLESDGESDQLSVNLYDDQGDFLTALVSFGLRKGKVVLRRYDDVDTELVESVKTKRGTNVINARKEYHKE